MNLHSKRFQSIFAGSITLTDKNLERKQAVQQPLQQREGDREIKGVWLGFGAEEVDSGRRRSNRYGRESERWCRRWGFTKFSTVGD